MTDLLHSGKRTPCPVCRREKDQDCSWTEDKKTILCHTYAKEQPPAEINGFYFSGKYCNDGIHGPDSAAIFSADPPEKRSGRKRQATIKSDKAKRRDTEASTAHVESEIDDSIQRILNGAESIETARIRLSQWCKEYKYDKFSASRLLEKKYKAIKESVEPEEKCRLRKRFEKVEKQIGEFLRFNSLAQQVELSGQPVQLENVRLELALKHNIEVPSADCEGIVMYLAKKRAYSPIQEYLNQCMKNFPMSDSAIPENRLLGDVMAEILGVDDKLHIAYLRKTLIAAVARAFNPGCKVDTVCIFTGSQGVGKSSFWRILAGEDYFDDSVGAHSDKDERLKLHQAWFVEWAELEAVFKRKEVGAIKAFITTQIDKIRPPYAREIGSYPRPSIIVGTTNHQEFLADPTGARRYWVIPLRGHINLPLLEQVRDRLWAAAAHFWKAGEKWTLPKELIQAAADQALDYSLSDPWEEVIWAYIGDRTEITIHELLTNALKIEVSRQDRSSQMRCSNLLKSRGWISRRGRVDGKPSRIWFASFLPLEVGTVGSPKVEASDSNGLGVIQPLIQPQKKVGSPPQRLDHPEPPPDPTSDPTSGVGWNTPQSNCDKGSEGVIQPDPTFLANFRKKISVGDRVEILTGGFSGRIVPVVEVSGDRVWVKAPRWQIRRDYSPDQLRLEVGSPSQGWISG